MNEIALSTDINVITAEINSYKQIAGQSIWEIGRRLIHVKENDLSHGEFITWLDSINMDRREAYKFMQVASEIPNDETFSHLGTTALYLITTLPEDEKQEQLERVEQGDNPTVRELQDIKRQLKQRDDELADRDKRINQLSKAFQDISAKEPKVIEKQVEVVPTDYESTKLENEKLVERNATLQQDYQKLLMERKEVDEKSEKYEQLSKAIKSAEGELSKQQKLIADYKKLSDLLEKSNDFLGKASALVYLDLSEVVNSDGLARRELNFLIERLDKFLSELTKLTQTDYIEGEIING
ncbi:MAG: DUF3102 domain-containing protein [Streptococcaceae bacterium]|nr:DUF3102 domain-containing protein [Streptococcaceae bacterium]